MKAPGLLVTDFKFFKHYHDILLDKLDENEKTDFMNCPSDESKFKFIHNKVTQIEELNFQFIFETSKDDKVAEEFKNKGNACFQQERYKEALEMYNQALIHIKINKGKTKFPLHNIYLFSISTYSYLVHLFWNLKFCLILK